MAVKNESLIPSVLALEKKLVPSDGYLYGTVWDERHQKDPVPLKLNEKSVRGTISNRLKAAQQNDPLKLNAEVEKPNLQTIDACALTEHHNTLKLGFTLKVLGGVEKPSACNGPNFNATLARAGAMKQRPTTPRVPAIKEPKAAIPKAGPARPFRAIA